MGRKENKQDHDWLYYLQSGFTRSMSLLHRKNESGLCEDNRKGDPQGDKRRYGRGKTWRAN
jgi:hypothetical protein